jgi:hypothetical protein
MQATGVQAGWQMNIKPSITLLVCEIGIWHPNIHLLFVCEERSHDQSQGTDEVLLTSSVFFFALVV